MFKVNNKGTRPISLTLFWCLYCNFEHNSHQFLVFPLLTSAGKYLLRVLNTKLCLKVARVVNIRLAFTDCFFMSSQCLQKYAPEFCLFYLDLELLMKM